MSPIKIDGSFFLPRISVIKDAPDRKTRKWNRFVGFDRFRFRQVNIEFKCILKCSYNVNY